MFIKTIKMIKLMATYPQIQKLYIQCKIAFLVASNLSPFVPLKWQKSI